MLTLLCGLILTANGPEHWVKFGLTAPNAHEVAIAGDFNAWGKPIPMSRNGESWSKQFRLPDDGRLEYKFVIDGKWTMDLANPNRAPNGIGEDNSVWQGPAYQFHALDQAPANPLKRTQVTVGDREITIFAPEQSQGLPIMVYADGPNYENPGQVQNVVANLVAEGKIQPLILVLIPPHDRLKEYGPDWKPYGSYLFDQVLPEVRRLTGGSDLAAKTFLGGSSMGGLIALRLAEEFPDRIAGGVHCQSAAVQWTALHLNNEEVAMPENLSKIAPSTKIWLDWGNFEEALTLANRNLVKRLKGNHRTYGSRVTDEGHCWTAWRNRLESGLIYLFGK